MAVRCKMSLELLDPILFWNEGRQTAGNIPGGVWCLAWSWFKYFLSIMAVNGRDWPLDLESLIPLAKRMMNQEQSAISSVAGDVWYLLKIQ